MDLDLVLLSRIQFALTIMFHYIFPPLTIGLGVLLIFFEGLYLKKNDESYLTITKFWNKIFGINFAFGVASGVVMEFQFGTNWANYSRFVGDVFGSPLAIEGIVAFFLESSFLAIMLFGWDRVGKKTHFFATTMVALGALLSSVWIIVANSWQQTPAGFHLAQDGNRIRAEITDFWAMVFNPSSVERLIHVVLGAYVLAGFFVMAVSAFYLLKKRDEDFAKKCLAISVIFSAISSLALLVSGHSQAIGVSRNQPAKLAAFEGHYQTGPGTLYAFGFPNDKENSVDFGLGLPGGLSFLVTGSFTEPIIGLDKFPLNERPPVNLTFQSYHLMVALGGFMIALSCFCVFMLWRKQLFSSRWLLWICIPSVLAPYIANQSGWVAAEVGRQPWLVYGLLKTSDGVSKAVSAPMVLTSIIGFTVVYAMLLSLWIFVTLHTINNGPKASSSH